MRGVFVLMNFANEGESRLPDKNAAPGLKVTSLHVHSTVNGEFSLNGGEERNYAWTERETEIKSSRLHVNADFHARRCVSSRDFE